MNMADEQKAKELVQKWCDINHHNKDLAPDVYDVVMAMAKWKEQQMCKSDYDLLDCALKYVRDRMPNPTWDNDEKLKERGLALDAPWC